MHPEISPCVACNRNHLSFIRCIILLKTRLPRPCLVDINPRKSGGFRSTYKQRSDQLARIIGCQSSSQCQPPRGDPERFSLASSSIRTYESPKDTGYIDHQVEILMGFHVRPKKGFSYRFRPRNVSDGKRRFKQRTDPVKIRKTFSICTRLSYKREQKMSIVNAETDRSSFF